MRSSVASMASNFGSFATRPRTNSKDRRTAEGGQWRETVRRRLLNAAERQGGAVVPEVRGEKIRFSARKRISSIDVELGSGWASISIEKLSGSSMAYKLVMNSFKSIFNASPIPGSAWKCHRASDTYTPCPERSSKAVTMHISLRKTPWNVGNGPLDTRSPSSEASSSASSVKIRSFKTFMRSLKKSMLTKCANLEIPDSAEGSNNVGTGFLRIRKYKANSSFKVSVC